jgi:hypothetical protein
MMISSFICGLSEHIIDGRNNFDDIHPWTSEHAPFWHLDMLSDKFCGPYFLVGGQISCFRDPADLPHRICGLDIRVSHVSQSHKNATW